MLGTALSHNAALRTDTPSSNYSVKYLVLGARGLARCVDRCPLFGFALTDNPRLSATGSLKTNRLIRQLRCPARFPLLPLRPKVGRVSSTWSALSLSLDLSTEQSTSAVDIASHIAAQRSTSHRIATPTGFLLFSLSLFRVQSCQFIPTRPDLAAA